MYQIEKKTFGYKLTFSGFIEEEEMKRWLEDSKTALKLSVGAFGVFVDMRALKPLPPNAQAAMQEGQKLFKEKGMNRSVVIVASQITKIQFMRIAKETGIYEWERYIAEQSHPDWERKGVAWLEKAEDPDVSEKVPAASRA